MNHRWRRRFEAVAGGAAGTAAMTLSLAVRARLRPDARQPIDYDGSDHVVVAAAKIVRWNPSSPTGRRVLFDVVHWGYGSAVALEHQRLRRLLGSDVKAGLAFFVGCQTMAFTLFPLLGETPPPWRWRRGLIVSSLAQHAIYAATVAAASAGFRRRRSHVSDAPDVYRI